ncbi:MAG: argininosuccinate lyase [Deltaproteobacteria bacterium]|nr:argininosuccinate lyase [Deltaproteobacteria bacterium]
MKDSKNNKRSKNGVFKLWGGRFEQEPSEVVSGFTNSLLSDMRLAVYDIKGGMAQAEGLLHAGIFDPSEYKRINDGLGKIELELLTGRFVLDKKDEDIHTAIERRLHSLIGNTAYKLHTGRSRNDQVVTAFRLYLLDNIKDTVSKLLNIQSLILSQASKHLGIPMPGFTHTQHAQPVLLSHHLLAYAEMFNRDIERLFHAYHSTSVMPLGSGALAGTPYNIDRIAMAELLEFKEISGNSIDAVSDRDFAIDTTYALSILMMHLSRLSEELILWSTDEFGFVSLPDSLTTGSSIMPQKKNPDVAELTRGKTGRVYGSLINLLTMMKGLPLSYNRDMQEDKPAVFEAVDTVKTILEVWAPVISGLRFNAGRLNESLSQGNLLATDIADYLVRQGMPFRKAHELTGRIVLYAIKKGVDVASLDYEAFKAFSPLFKPDIRHTIDIKNSINSRAVYGGTAEKQVKIAMLRLRKRIKHYMELLKSL